FTVQLSTDSGFGVINGSSITVSTAATISPLIPGTVYYGRVYAINHSGINTSTTTLGSTTTLTSPAPLNLQFIAATVNSLTAQWTAPNPSGDSYILQYSTDSGFGIVNGSSITTGVSATIGSLGVNTTYYARVASVLSGSTGSFTLGSVSTATLANAPVSLSSTWTMVGVTSVTVQWGSNGNPVGTRFTVQLSTDSGFGVINGSSTTISTAATVSPLIPGTVYYGRVYATNYSGINTSTTTLGSTTTLTSPFPTGLQFTAATVNSLTASWNPSIP